MSFFNRNKMYSNDDLMKIENNLLSEILVCRGSEEVEAATTYAKFLSQTGITNENYPLMMNVLQIGNHWVIDSLIGDRDPFLFFASIQPNHMIIRTCFQILSERSPGGIYPKSLSVVLGVIQASYNVPENGYSLYPLTISDINNLAKHLDEEVGQEDSLNRCIIDILENVSNLEGLLIGNQEIEELAIHSSDIRSHFFDDTKKLNEVIPKVMLVRMSYTDLELAPSDVIPFAESKLAKSVAEAEASGTKYSNAETVGNENAYSAASVATPAAPKGPVAPRAPAAPKGPVAPGTPAAPKGPSAPGGPVAPPKPGGGGPKK